MKVERIADNRVVINLSIGKQTKYKYIYIGMSYMVYLVACSCNIKP